MMASPENVALAEQVGKRRFPWSEPASYVLTRGALLRGLGFVYAVAFFSLSNQLMGLIGSHGLLPASRYLDELRSFGNGAPFEPTLFWFSSSDAALRAACDAGLVLSVIACAGFANSVVMAALWVLYTSFVNVGQVFYGYGWELLTLEAGFLAVFLAPPWDPRGRRSPPPTAIVWLYRWLLFRVMFGAGLIKLRGDPCWVHLTCLADHYETQPIPNPLSYYLHALPMWVHKAGALFNHFVELVVPWGLFGTRRIRHAAGVFTILFQVMLILSGNLSFLNWLTIVVALSAFDDGAFEELLPARARVAARIASLRDLTPTTARRYVVTGVTVVILMLSIFPAVNMISPDQRMNGSFEPFHLVNTYGAFGSVEHERDEVVLEGTYDDPGSPSARWLEYEFPCKPGDPKRRPCFVSPYHYRLDWQMWFAGLSNYRREPWIVKLVYELLRGNSTVLALLSKNPFPGRPPRYVRALLYRYEFTRNRKDGWWKRTLVGEYLRPMALDDPGLHEFLKDRDWLP